MNLFKIINWPIFLISFILGILYIYHMIPFSKEVVVYPTPDNVNEIQYKDNSGTVFEYRAKKVPCPKDTSQITEYPIQY